MTLFIGWSKELSHKIAQLFKDWIASVTPHIDPFVSNDIPPGTDWRTVLGESLEEANFGVLCITEYNLSSDWMSYEAGVLELSTRRNNPDGEARLAPILFDVKNTGDIPDAIRSKQSARYDDADAMWNLVESMNGVCVRLHGKRQQDSGKPLPPAYLQEDELRRQFEATYPAFVNRVRSALDDYKARASATQAQPAQPVAASQAAPVGQGSVTYNIGNVTISGGNIGSILASGQTGNNVVTAAAQPQTAPPVTQAQPVAQQPAPVVQPASQASETPSVAQAAPPDSNATFSDALASCAQQFPYPEMKAVCFEGQSFAELYRDKNASFGDMSDALTNFLRAADKEIGSLEHAPDGVVIPERKARIRALKGLKDAARKLNLH